MALLISITDCKTTRETVLALLPCCSTRMISDGFPYCTAFPQRVFSKTKRKLLPFQRNLSRTAQLLLALSSAGPRLLSLLREGAGYLFTWTEINFFLGFGNSWKHQLFQTKFRINYEIPSISVLQVKEKLNKNKMFQKYTHIKAHRFCYNVVFSSKTLVADCLPVASQNRLHEFLFLHFRILTPLVLVRLNNPFPTTQMNYIQGIGFRLLGFVPQKQNLMWGIRVSLTFLYLCSFI